MWDIRKDKPAYNLIHNLKGFPSSSAWSTTEPNTIVLGSEIGELSIYDLRNFSHGLVKKLHERLIRQIKINNTNLIATVSEDCMTKVSQVVAPSVINEKDLKTLLVLN